MLQNIKLTYSLHCSSFWGLPFRILNIDLVQKVYLNPINPKVLRNLSLKVQPGFCRHLLGGRAQGANLAVQILRKAGFYGLGFQSYVALSVVVRGVLVSVVGEALNPEL